MVRHWLLKTIILCTLGLMPACSDSQSGGSPSGQAGPDAASGARVLPTLYPTATVSPTPAPTDTRPPRPTAIPATEVPFEQLVVDLRYTIPALALDRRIRGNVSGEIELIDEESGQALRLRNRSGVILEMQQALPRADLEEVPADCAGCVQLDYELPLTGETGQGWLSDVQLLASLENYTALFLGPHFPPDTVIGLRRAATPYHVAHSAAITADGQLWTWTATEAEIDGPSPAAAQLGEATADLELIDWDNIPASLGQVCYDGAGQEQLYLTGPDGPQLVEIRCPELYLPGQLLPLYLGLSGAVDDKLEDDELAPPELPLTLETMLTYRRDDGAQLTLMRDGLLTAVDGEGTRFTTTLTTTLAVSLTAPLLDNTLLEPQVSSILSDDPVNAIVIRTEEGVYELAWDELDSILEAIVGPWNELLERIIRVEAEDAAEPGQTPTPTEPEQTATPEVSDDS